MTTDVARNHEETAELLERVLIQGDLSKLTTRERLEYYRSVCTSVGLNPLTKPFEYLHLNGKLQLYARKDATDQLRKLHEISVERLEREIVEGVYVVTAYMKVPSGRTDSDLGAVPIDGLKGEARANAILKAVTKAKRRTTLSICGLGMLDETELETIPASALKTLPEDRTPFDGAVETEPESGRPEVSVPPEDWEILVNDFADRFKEATNPKEAEGWRQHWLTARKTVPEQGRKRVEEAIVAARERLHGAA